jgi:transposase-like protein
MVRMVVEEEWSVARAAAEFKVSQKDCSKWLARYREASEGGLLDRSSACATVADRTDERRIERERPGELIHIDVKELERIRGGAGHRMTGRRHYTPRLIDAAGRRRGTAGWDYEHVAIDDATRLAFAEVLPDASHHRGSCAARSTSTPATASPSSA